MERLASSLRLRLPDHLLPSMAPAGGAGGVGALAGSTSQSGSDSEEGLTLRPITAAHCGRIASGSAAPPPPPQPPPSEVQEVQCSASAGTATGRPSMPAAATGASSANDQGDGAVQPAREAVVQRIGSWHPSRAGDVDGASAASTPTDVGPAASAAASTSVGTVVEQPLSDGYASEEFEAEDSRSQAAPASPAVHSAAAAPGRARPASAAVLHKQHSAAARSPSRGPPAQQVQRSSRPARLSKCSSPMAAACPGSRSSSRPGSASPCKQPIR